MKKPLPFSANAYSGFETVGNRSGCPMPIRSLFLSGNATGMRKIPLRENTHRAPLHVEDVGVVDAGHGLYGAEPARRRVVTAEFVVLRDDEHLVAAPCHDFVHSLEVRMAFDPLAVGVEEIQSVVGADPEERVRGDGDLLDEIS